MVGQAVTGAEEGEGVLLQEAEGEGLGHCRGQLLE